MTFVLFYRGVYLTAEKLGLGSAVGEFMKEFVRMCTQITPHEIERAKNQLKTHLLLQLDGTTPICEEIGRHMLVYGRRIPLAEMLDRINVSILLLNTSSVSFVAWRILRRGVVDR